MPFALSIVAPLTCTGPADNTAFALSVNACPLLLPALNTPIATSTVISISSVGILPSAPASTPPSFFIALFNSDTNLASSSFPFALALVTPIIFALFTSPLSIFAFISSSVDFCLTLPELTALLNSLSLICSISAAFSCSSVWYRALPSVPSSFIIVFSLCSFLYCSHCSSVILFISSCTASS